MASPVIQHQYGSTNQPPPPDHQPPNNIGALPFGGLDVAILAFAGVAVLMSGTVLRRLSRRP